MKREDLSKRTKKFALRIMNFVESLPPGDSSRVLGRQLLRAATSVGANYRAAQRAKSTAHFISKLADVEEEADECCYWLELIQEAGFLPTETPALLSEADEITAMIVASIKTVKLRSRMSNSAPHKSTPASSLSK